MNLIIGIVLVIAFIVMVVWPTLDDWFKDLNDEDDWTDKW